MPFALSGVDASSSLEGDNTSLLCTLQKNILTFCIEHTVSVLSTLCIKRWHARSSGYYELVIEATTTFLKFPTLGEPLRAGRCYILLHTTAAKSNNWQVPIGYRITEIPYGYSLPASLAR